MLLWQGVATGAEWNLGSLMFELGQRSSGQASFSETKYLAVLNEPLEQSGTLAFAPGRLEKFTQHPHEERMTVIDDAVTIQLGADGRKRRLKLHRYPALWGIIEGLRATLTGDLDVLRQFYDVELHGSVDDWELVMMPNRPEMAAVVRLVSVRGSFGRVSVIEVVQENSDRSLMRITEDRR
ncbi:MAG: outer membrane lipoprotein carrier protein LolA [Burkholderiales bacterium]|nr:outer membrane lipoprotein carrier protein LolA [Burkholderiales bacterium]